MIDCMTWATSYEFQDTLPRYHKLRYRLLVRREGWKIPHFDNMEYDQFDTPATVYLIKRSRDGECIGGARLYPTTQPYMTEVLWPELMNGRPLPRSPKIWEGSRLIAAPELSHAERRQVRAELRTAVMEFCVEHGIEKKLFQLTHDLLAGWMKENPGQYEPFGKVLRLDDGSEIVGGYMNVSQQLLTDQRVRAGITGSILRYPLGELPYLKVA